MTAAASAMVTGDGRGGGKGDGGKGGRGSKRCHIHMCNCFARRILLLNWEALQTCI